jgi:uncharacterized protein
MDTMKTSTRLLCLLILVFFAGAEVASAQTRPENQMKNYYLVFLKKGPNRSQDSATAAAIQAGHMANIQRLAREKKLKVAGPMLDEGDVRGIFILDVPTLEEARRLTEADPAVKAGRLIMEIHPWMTQKGACLD